MKTSLILAVMLSASAVHAAEFNDLAGFRASDIARMTVIAPAPQPRQAAPAAAAAAGPDKVYSRYQADFKAVFVVQNDQNNPRYSQAQLNNALFYAAFQLDIAAADRLMRLGASSSAVDTNGRTALMTAVMRGAGPQLISVLGNGNLEVMDPEGKTVLAYAAGSGSALTVRTLLSLGADAYACAGDDCVPPIAYATTAAAVKEFLKVGVDVNRIYGKNKLTALAIATYKRTPTEIKALVGAGAQVNYNGLEASRTAMFAIAEPQVKLENIKALLAAGADVNARNRFGWTPLMEVLDKSLGQDRVRFLLEAGADANLAVKNTGYTPLMIASYKELPASHEGNIEDVKLLLAAGADVNAITLPNADVEIDGTALTCAVYQDHMEIAQMLIAAGADVNKAGNSGSPLGWACRHGSVRMVKLLIAAHVDVNQTSPRKTPLAIALEVGNQEIINMLTAAGAH